MNEISDAIDILVDEGLILDQITVLHCTTEYPAPITEVNLKAMMTIAENFKVKVGYSDHTEGIEISLAAVAMGATVIEKHFTLDKSMPGPDHKASLEPTELINLVRSIRRIEQAIGNGNKIPSASETKNKEAARKSIHTKISIKKGKLLSKDDLIMKRPGDGISPMRLEEVVGKKAKTDMPADHKISYLEIE